MQSRIRKRFLAAILLLAFVSVPWLSAKAEDPWEFLKGFTLIPGSAARFEEHYVAALFVNSEKRLIALVIFNATCESERCAVNNPAAYSVFDAEGFSIRLYVDPREQELMRLMANKLAV